MNYIFTLTKWNENRSKLIDRKTIRINRKCRFAAKQYLKLKNPTYFIELDS